MRKTSTSSEPGSPLIPASPKPLSPGTPTFGDQEEVYKSLRRTTAEIQSYSFETLGKSSKYYFGFFLYFIFKFEMKTYSWLNGKVNVLFKMTSFFI